MTTSDEARQHLAKDLLSSLDRPVINGQVLRELGRVLLQKGGFSEGAYMPVLRAMHRSCRVVPDSEETFALASLLRKKRAFSYWDSLIVAAALDAGCDTLYSEDMQHGQLVEGRLRLVNPFVGL
ncbi:MAG: PIN domain-containing protein [Rhodocyclaceae bacterium]|nr:PIN domain-containing protein [Rhodocyclaceae bacterium]